MLAGRRSNRSRAVAALVLSASLFAAAGQASPLPRGYLSDYLPTKPGHYLVTAVHDGDTIDVTNSGRTETVRLIGVDTPESQDPRKPVQCYSYEASRFTQQNLLGRYVRLEADPATSNRDKYDRLLRYVLLENELFNARLVREGYGFAYVVFPFGQLETFRRQEVSAREEGRALWQHCEVNQNDLIKQTQAIKL